MIEFEFANYEISVNMFQVLKEYVNKNKIELPSEFMNNVQKSQKIAHDSYIEQRERKKGGKQVPYTTGGLSKKKSLRDKPFQRLKNIP